MTWRFGLWELTSATRIGEVLEADQRRLLLPLNGLPTASFTIRLDNPIAGEIVSRSGDLLVAVYQDSTLRFIGEPTLVESDGIHLTMNAQGPFWRLQKRLMGWPYGQASPPQWYHPTFTAANTIIADLIVQANGNSIAGQNKDTGIRLGTLDTLYSTTLGSPDAPLSFKTVAETITELQAAKVPFPVGDTAQYLAFDDFSGHSTGTPLTTTTENLHAYNWHAPTLPSGMTNDTDDFVFDSTSTLVQRIQQSDSGDGRFSGIQHDFAAAAFNTSWKFIDVGGGFNGLQLGIYGRCSTAGIVVGGVDVQSGQAFVTKYTPGGGSQTLYQTTGLVLTSNFDYQMRLLIDANGIYQFWVSAGEPSNFAPVCQGFDADLATGGALATGEWGLWNYWPVAADVGRYWFDVWVSDYGPPQSFDFEIAPSEPTADTNQNGVVGAGLKIGTLNVRTRIGADKPDVVFEYGTGSKSVTNYTRTISREGLINQAVHLGADFPTTADIVSSSNLASQTARGLFQEVVPGDFTNLSLRKAWTDANVAVRGAPLERVTFEPGPNAPVFGTDFIVGDSVTARAIVNGTVQFNGLFRVFGIDLSIDENGKETLKPILLIDS